MTIDPMLLDPVVIALAITVFLACVLYGGFYAADKRLLVMRIQTLEQEVKTLKQKETDRKLQEMINQPGGDFYRYY